MRVLLCKLIASVMIGLAVLSAAGGCASWTPEQVQITKEAMLAAVDAARQAGVHAIGFVQVEVGRFELSEGLNLGRGNILFVASANPPSREPTLAEIQGRYPAKSD